MGIFSGILDSFTGGIGGSLLNMATNAVSGAQSASQARATNKFSAQQAVLDRNWSGQQAQNQMNFQSNQAGIARDYETNMANTSYQRAVGDLGKAGLNPMLSIMHGGAATPNSPSPQGAMGHSSAPRGAMGQTFASTNNALNGAQLAEIKSRIDLNSAQKAKVEAETEITPTIGPLNVAKTGQADATAMNERNKWEQINQETRKIKFQIGNLVAERGLIEAGEALKRVEATTSKSHASLANANAELATMHTLLEKAKLPEAQQNAKLYQNFEDLKALEKVGGVLNSAGGILGLSKILKGR